MANFANDHWYQITLQQFGLEKPLLSLATANTTNNGSSPVFMQLTNTSMPNQRWQIWRAANDSYILRSGNSGPWGYMVAIANASDTGSSGTLDANRGNTVPAARNYANIIDNAYLWKINPWGDGSFHFSNAANGTDWHLQKEVGHGGMSLSSNITGNQPGQKFIFNSLEKITRDAFATLNLPPSSTTSAAPTETSIDLSDGSSGLSDSAIAGIGAGIGALALLCIILGGLLIFRRRRNKKQASATNAAGYANMHDPKISPGGGVSPGWNSAAPPYNYAAGYSAHPQPPPPVELSEDTQQRAELGGYTHVDQASKDSAGSDAKSQSNMPVELEAQHNVSRQHFGRN